MGKRELDTEEALFDSKAQKDFIKNVAQCEAASKRGKVW